jgi:hypothetical protein
MLSYLYATKKTESCCRLLTRKFEPEVTGFILGRVIKTKRLSTTQLYFFLKVDKNSRKCTTLSQASAAATGKLSELPYDDTSSYNSQDFHSSSKYENFRTNMSIVTSCLNWNEHVLDNSVNEF